MLRKNIIGTYQRSLVYTYVACVGRTKTEYVRLQQSLIFRFVLEKSLTLLEPFSYVYLEI